MRLKLKSNENETIQETIKRLILGSIEYDNEKHSKEFIADFEGALKRLEWVGLFSKELKVPDDITTSIDALCHTFQAKLSYQPGEKDMIAMKHTFEVVYEKEGGRREKVECVLFDQGLQTDKDKEWSDSDSSMNRTVGLPLACAVRGVLEGRITRKGVLRPITKDLYEPILNEMERLGVKFNHTVTKM